MKHTNILCNFRILFLGTLLFVYFLTYNEANVSAVKLRKNWQLNKSPSVLFNKLTKISQEWFEGQLLDHFDPANKATWRQKYYVSMEYFDKTNSTHAPVFLMFGGESAVNGDSLNGEILQNAIHFKAAMAVLEHRYYGESRPTR